MSLAGKSGAMLGAVSDDVARPATAAQSGCIVCSGPTEISVRELFDTRFGIDSSFDVWRCRQCGLEQLFPAPHAAQLKSLYERFYNFSGERGTLYTTLRELFFASFLYRLWIRLDGDISFHTSRGTGRLLDIGCNEGRTLKNYARNGFAAEGAELNEHAAELARAAGFRVFCGPLEDYDPSAPYDIAVLSNVLEHALDPRAMLESVRRLLKRGGQVWISCPNRESWLRSVFGRRWIHWHVPFHISHFSGGTLGALLEERSEEMISQLRAVPDDRRPFEARLRARVGRVLAYVQAHRAFYAIANEQARLDPKRREPLREPSPDL